MLLQNPYIGSPIDSILNNYIHVPLNVTEMLNSLLIVIETLVFIVEREENILGKGKMKCTSIFPFSKHVFESLFQKSLQNL